VSTIVDLKGVERGAELRRTGEETTRLGGSKTARESLVSLGETHSGSG